MKFILIAKKVFPIYCLLVLFLISCMKKDADNKLNSDIFKTKIKSDTLIVLTTGDTLKTGVAVKLKKEETLLGEVSVIELQKPPKTFKANKNTHVVKDPPKIILPSIQKKIKASKLKNIKIGKDTVLVGKELRVGISKPVKANAPFYKDNTLYDIQCMGLDQGLNSEYIYSIIEDSKGNIWFGHYFGGVSKFDGKEFTNFTEESGLLSSNNIWTMLEDNEGDFWFVCSGKGVIRYDGKTFIQYSEENGFLSNNIHSIIQDRDNNIWFATDKGAVRYNGDQFTYYNKNDGLSGNILISMLEDSKGNIWMGSTTGMTIYSESTFISYTSKDGLPAKNIISIFEDDDKNIWFGHYDGGVCKYDGNSLATFTEEEGLINNSIKAIKQDAHGNIWFGSNIGGLSKYDGKTFQHITTKEGLPSDRIRTLLIDSKQNLWGGTEAGGVFKFNLDSFINFDQDPEGILAKKQMFALFQDTKNNMWFGNRYGELRKYDGENYTVIGKEEGLSHYVIFSIDEDQNNNIWIGAWSGLIKYDGKQFTVHNRKSGLGHERIFDLLVDKNNNIWFLGYGTGISKFDGKKITNYTLSENPEENKVLDIYEDHNRDLWFGTESFGICKYDDKKDMFTFYTKNEGLASNYVLTILEDRDENIWVGTDSGISKYDGDKFSYFTKKEGLAANVISSIIEDLEGNLWLGTERGISCIIYDEELVSKVDDSKKIDANKAFVLNFNKTDGLKSLDFYGEAHLDKNKNIWWSTSKGLIKLDINNYDFTKEVPKLRLNTIEINENFIDYNALKNEDYVNSSEFLSEIKKGSKEVKAFNNYPENLTLSHNLNHLNFKFSAIEWSAPHDIKYSYKIEGLDKTWSVPSSNNYADYRNIPSGDYVFNVKTIGKSGQWSAPLQYKFSISPPWWLSLWAIYGYAFLGILLILGSFKWYIYRMKKKQLILEYIVEERTRTIAHQKEELSVAYSDLEQERNKMELKALLNQINPHFIFNALNSIQQFVISNNVKTSLDYFNKFGKLIRSSLEHSEMKFVSINDEIQVISNYVDLENLRFNESVVLNFEVNNIDIYNTKIPPMFIQPIVENAIIHGLSKKENEKEINTRFEEFEDYILCSIHDNGLGRKHIKSVKNKNSGMVITNKRLKSVWNTNDKKYMEVIVEDLKEPTGTIVKIKLPKDF